MFEQYQKVMQLSEQSIVRAMVESIGKLGLTLGPSAVMSRMELLTGWLKDILTRNAVYQLERESFDENEEDFVTYTVVLDVM